MAIVAALHHKTIYQFDQPTTLGPHLIRLRPAPYTRVPIRSYALKVTPEKHFLNWQQDAFGNWMARCVFPDKARALSIDVDVVFEHAVINPFDFFIEPYATEFPFAYDPALRNDLAPYRKAPKSGPLADGYLESIPKRTSSVDVLVGLNERLARDVAYRVRLEPGTQTPEQTLSLREGSCRDTSWLLVQLARRLGFAARFVSGYLVQLAPDDLAGGGAARDSVDLHAWAEIFLPGAGWIGFDPTSGLLAGEGHIPLAATPHHDIAAPVSGSVEFPAAQFDVEMSIARLVETPRVTAPFSDQAWLALNRLGEAVEADLKKYDVRLTMGGEPTFVSIDDYQAPEWNIAADGPSKRAKADELLTQLRQRYAPNGLLHYGQGKWYPGEVLPRWAFSLIWRLDGQAILAAPERIARQDATGEDDAESAQRLAAEIAGRLGIDPSFVLPAFEESNALVAFVLPVRRLNPASIGAGWISEHWIMPRDKFYLTSGTSPAGHRLPLSALPEVAPDKYPYIVERDPSEPRDDLPKADAFFAAYRRPAPKPTAALDEVVRTALVVEARDGVLHVFMPPVATAEDYLELLSAIEQAAIDLNRTLRIEGYEPPRDPRLTFIKVTPDPGVVEVNVQPATSWRECVDATLTLYEDARACRLRAEKFMIDGRHTGTGGGNHIVVGGATALDSPFLRRPDLLKSLLIYWQQHPSLSYLFSGLFIGPSSQAPRIDEARHDALYELEIALSAIPKPGADDQPPAPWLVDRLLRNLLADMSGNTHRTEICIDKLFSPDGPAGRLGLLEFRGFEMPPEARMSLAQQVLLRALIAWFWKTPRDGALVRWGAALADRFMLSQFVWEDFQDVLADLKSAGYAFDPAWFEAQREFRFPYFGVVDHEGVQIELRYALEPWHVMGEQGAQGGVVRYVDSSVERLEVRVRNAVAGRHLVLCNGRVIPLANTREAGLEVGGVRFKAWKQPTGLHPTIPVHAPLTFDLYDGWNGRSVGGFVYHVSHPAGRNYESFPVNSNEAEARRLARFVASGHTGGAFAAPAHETNPEFAVTLDLRRPPRA